MAFERALPRAQEQLETLGRDRWSLSRLGRRGRRGRAVVQLVPDLGQIDGPEFGHVIRLVAALAIGERGDLEPEIASQVLIAHQVLFLIFTPRSVAGLTGHPCLSMVRIRGVTGQTQLVFAIFGQQTKVGLGMGMPLPFFMLTAVTRCAGLRADTSGFTGMA